VIAYFIAVIAYFVWHGNFILPDHLFVIGMVFALSRGRFRAFLLDWTPLMLLLLGYEFIRGLVGLLNKQVHAGLMIDFDRYVFGTVPSIALQSHFFTPGEPHWYDYTAVSLYLMHFIIPLTAAFYFWLNDRRLFKQYAAALVTLSYLAYLTYLAFPAAPPWMAAQAGVLPGVTKIMDVTFSHFGHPIYLPTVYRFVGVNLVAAVPSLHAAYPLLTTIFVGKKLPLLFPPLAVYTASVWVALVYLGEHYAFDVLAGGVYVLFTYGLVGYWPTVKRRLASLGHLAFGCIPAAWFRPR
jgi:hypothetical protein